MLCTISARICVTYLLDASVNGHLVPLMVVESNARWLDVHLLFAVRQSHCQRDATVAKGQIQIVRVVACTQYSISLYNFII